MNNKGQSQIKCRGELKQSWSHIKDEIEPSDGRLVFKIQDYYIREDSFKKDNFVHIKPSTAFFTDFKVKNKNSGRELSFIEEYNLDDKKANIKVNLGSISDWPPVGDTDYLHVKIEYEYVDYWPIFEKRSILYPGTKIPNDNENNDYNIRLPRGIIEKLKLIFIPGYKGQFVMSGDSLGDISITVPLGMNIGKRGKSTSIIFYEGPIDQKTPQTEMSYTKPHITINNGKLKYNYIINDISFDYILKTMENNFNTYFFIEYNVVNDLKFFLMPVLAITVFSVALFIDWNNGDWYYFVVILLSISTLYLTLRKEKYQIPFNKITSSLIFLSVLFLSIKPFIVDYLSKIFIIVGLIDIIFFIYVVYVFKSLILVKEVEKVDEE